MLGIFKAQFIGYFADGFVNVKNTLGTISTKNCNKK